MAHTDYVNSYPWFAWYPVRTVTGDIVWWKWLRRVTDERDEVYLGLLPRTYYFDDLL